MLAQLEELYAGSGLGFRKMSGYDPGVWSHLEPALRTAGWEVGTSSLMLRTETPTREANPDVEIRAVPPDAPDLESLYRTDGELDRGFELVRSQFDRLGGEYLVGYLDGRPASCTGWFVADRMARFRHVLTAPWARGRGCATTLIRHVQRHPTVRAQDGLVLLVSAEGPGGLYHRLGFRTVMPFWEARSGGSRHGATACRSRSRRAP